MESSKMNDRNQSKRLLTAGVVGVLLFAAGCAGKRIAPSSVGDGNSELPQEFAERFAVKETSSAKEAEPKKVTSAVSEPAPQVGKQSPSARVKKTESSAKSVVATPTPSPSPTGAFEWPKRRPEKDPLWIGERHTFEITYFGLAAGIVDVDILPFKEIQNRKVYHIKGRAQSSKVFTLIYRLDDTVETFVDYEGFFSHRFRLVLDEDMQTRDAIELNDSLKAQTYYWNRWNHKKRGYTETKETKPIPPFSQDSLSALYYIRTLPLKVGEVYSFPIVSEGNFWEAQVTVVRKEQMNTPMGRINAIVLKPEPKYTGNLSRAGDSFIWVSDDDRRFILRFEAKVRIGTVVAALKSIQPGTAP
jgi:hypothetical protein